MYRLLITCITHFCLQARCSDTPAVSKVSVFVNLRKERRYTQCDSTRMDSNTEILRRQIMVNQFVNAVGCSPDQASQILQSAQWHLEVSRLFVESMGLYKVTTLRFRAFLARKLA